MSFGIEVKDPNGGVVFDSRRLTAHKIGEYTPTTRQGSFTVPSGHGDVWATTSILMGNGLYGTGVWVVGNQVHWSMFFDQVSSPSVISYGRYSR